MLDDKSMETYSNTHLVSNFQFIPCISVENLFFALYSCFILKDSCILASFKERRRRFKMNSEISFHIFIFYSNRYDIS